MYKLLTSKLNLSCIKKENLVSEGKYQLIISKDCAFEHGFPVLYIENYTDVIYHSNTKMLKPGLFKLQTQRLVELNINKYYVGWFCRHKV